MTPEQIKARMDKIAAERQRAMFGSPSGADDDLDGDAPRKCPECVGCGYELTSGGIVAGICPACDGSGEA